MNGGHTMNSMTFSTKDRRRMTGAKLAVLLCSAALTHAAICQDQGGDTEQEDRRSTSVFEEIVVTSQKREQNIQDVGIAVTAFSGNQLEQIGLKNSIDLINFTPNVSLAGDIGGQRAIFNIRGIVQNDFADSAEAPVAVYIDGAYLASTQAQTFGLFDIGRVEILKGPQGTLFGRNATGGLVNTITAKPSYEFEAYLEMTLARFNQTRVEGALSGSLGEGVRGRLSVLSNTQAEILRNVADGFDANGKAGTPGGGGDTYNDETQAIRGQVEFDLGSRGALLLAGNFADTVTSSSPYQVVNTTQVVDDQGRIVEVIFAADDPLGCVNLTTSGTCAKGEVRPLQGGDFFGNPGDPDGSGNLIDRDFAFDDQNKIRSWGISATAEFGFDFADLVAITDYKNFSRVVGIDSDQTPTPGLIFQSDGDIDQFSQEVRLSGDTDQLNWVAGFYYLGIRTDHTQGLADNIVDHAGILGGSESNTISEVNTDSFSLFAQTDLHFSDSVRLVAGLRAVQENKSLRGTVITNPNNDDRVIEVDANGMVLETADIDNNDTLWSGKLQLEYLPDPDQLYYVGVNRGVKAGGFNTPLLGGFSPYDQEVLLSYEAGAKLTLLDGQLRLNGAVFYYDYEDYQSFSFINNASAVSNEQARYIGGEIELFVTPALGWELFWGASYIDAEVQDLSVADGVFADVPPPFTPEFQTSGFVRYAFDLKANGELALQATASYQTEVFHNARAYTAHSLGDRLQAGVQIAWSDLADGWSATAYIDNVTDSDDAVIGFDVSGFYGTSQISYLKPRTYGVRVRKTF